MYYRKMWLALIVGLVWLGSGGARAQITGPVRLSTRPQTSLYPLPYNSPVLALRIDTAHYQRHLALSALSFRDSIDRQTLSERLGVGQMLADRIFGPGGIRFKLTGSLGVGVGVRQTYTANPLLSEQARRQRSVEVDEQIQARLQAEIGTKLKFGLSYNTQSSFQWDARQLRLAYEGGEDDIIKLIEVGRVSMQPRNSLIQGSEALMGIHTRMQLGRLWVDLLASQQRSQTRRVSSSSSGQSRSFELRASDYDANRHFFLSDYFRSTYDDALSTRPHIRSGIKIERIEVWVTNRQGRYEDSRSVLALADLGEAQRVHSPAITPLSSGGIQPHNMANSLYGQLLQSGALRQPHEQSPVLGGQLVSGRDYERIGTARLLDSAEYSVHEQLGYITLSARLLEGEALAVAYQYSYRGQTYQVGELTSDRPEGASEQLFVKLLRGSDLSPNTPYWHYMMRNVYALGNAIGDPSGQDFRLEPLYISSELGRETPYINGSNGSSVRILDLLGLDKVDAGGQGRSDGRFDYLPSLTVDAPRGLIFLPSVEPFGQWLRQMGVEARYIYDELYDETQTQARQRLDKDRYVLRGAYRSGTGSDISLGATHLMPGSVRVMAGGQRLEEQTDYIVDYTAGSVRIINEHILSSGVPIDVSLEDVAGEGMQRRTMLGVDLGYQLTRELHLGATAMYLSQTPLSSKVALGSEAMRNLIWGANISWRHEAPWLTDWLNRLPLLDLSKPSYISLDAEVAQLLPGYHRDGYHDGYSYLDDFETSRSEISLLSPHAWSLSSVPLTLAPAAMTGLETGYGRAQLSWFSIDPLFTREYSRYTPGYIRTNPELVSHHYVRDVEVRELYPYRVQQASHISYLSTLNLRYLPSERGPYNLSTSRLRADGSLSNPRDSWAGITRRIDQSDFERAGVQYLEFWLMDPFHYNANHQGGDLYINLGDISEDVLRDGYAFAESGLPLTDDPSLVEATPWGMVPRGQTMGYTFDSSLEARRRQDVGLDGLSSTSEGQHTSYSEYLEHLRQVVSPETLMRWRDDPHSPLRDPAGDDFRHYRSAVYDRAETPILERYRYYNGTEGNSSESSADTEGTEALVSRLAPDAEDLDQDLTLNDRERYYEYRISLRPEDLLPARGYIIAERESEVVLRNGHTDRIKWYQFRIPLDRYTRVIGGMRDLRSVRFMRLYLSGFAEEVNLRFGSLHFTRGDWRMYPYSLHDPNTTPSEAGRLEIGAVGIDTHGDRSPVSYTLPPSVSRRMAYDTSESTQQNEEALSLRLSRLASGDARAVYREVRHDLRRYGKLQLFVHAEALDSDGMQPPLDGDMSLFLRLGSDLDNHYYEYTVPLSLTPWGQYSSLSEVDRARVWPRENMIDVSLDAFTNLKKERLAEATRRGVPLNRYSTSSPTDPRHSIGIVGNPSLSHVRSLVIGVRNMSGEERSIEVWVNELRVGQGQSEGGWAANASLALQLSDLASVHLRGRRSTAGFGALDALLLERQMDDRQSLGISSSIQLGRLLPEKAQANIPLHLSYNDEQSRPKYNPLDQDLRLDEALSSATSSEARARIEDYALRRRTTRALSLSGMKVGIRSPKPMPYDPANLSIDFSHSSSELRSPDVEYQRQLHWQAGLSYDYAPTFAPLRPFAHLSGEGAWARYWRQYGLSLWPSRLFLQTTMMRHYEEEQVRNHPDLSYSEKLPATFSQLFVWNRRLSLSWSLTPNLSLTLTTGTDARIDEPYEQVNRELNPDGYALWRRRVDESIAHLGTPMRYNQTASMTYTLPTQMIAPLKFVQAGLRYSSTYLWERGAEVQSQQLPHTISNQMTLEGNAHLNFSILLKKRAAVRDLALSYRLMETTHLPGFIPTIGAALGQSSERGVMSPGLAFALGLSDASFIDRAADRGWLTTDTDNVLPGVYAQARNIDLKASLQPLPHLTLQLSATYHHSERTEVRYMHDGRPRQSGGSLMMTTIGLRGIFSSPQAEGGYADRLFELLRSTSQGAYQEQLSALSGRNYPRSGFLADASWGGRPVEPAHLSGQGNPSVLIPAFRSTYTLLGKGGQGRSRILPTALSMLPNWTLTYSGLSHIDGLKQLFRSVVLRHAYRGIYRIDRYTSLPNWVPLEGESVLGAVPSQTSEVLVPRISLPWDIATISLQESFFPLLGVDLTLRNGMTLTTQWRKHRGLTLSVGNARLVEARSNELNLGWSYRLSSLKALFSPSARRKAAASNNAGRGISLRVDYSLRHNLSLVRQIESGYSQATIGHIDSRLSLSAEYEISRLVALRSYYEWQHHRPLVSTGSYPITTSLYGISLRLSLPQ